MQETQLFFPWISEGKSLPKKGSMIEAKGEHGICPPVSTLAVLKLSIS